MFNITYVPLNVTDGVAHTCCAILLACHFILFSGTLRCTYAIHLLRVDQDYFDLLSQPLFLDSSRSVCMWALIRITTVLLFLLILSGDIQQNPGPQAPGYRNNVLWRLIE